jgi:hypothetical protein
VTAIEPNHPGLTVISQMMPTERPLTPHNSVHNIGSAICRANPFVWTATAESILKKVRADA